MLDSNVLAYGSAEPLPKWLDLRAGPLTLQYDPENLSLRYIRLGGQEVLRSIYAAIRDRNWGTVRPRIANFQITSSADSFRIAFDAHCRQREIDFVWHGTLTGDASGAVGFTFDGEARTSFWRARIGLCVLHPLRECAGRPCVVEHSDGRLQESEFPQWVAPAQPFLDVRAITNEIMPGLRAEVRFEGDIFETEDHRNWTDASFKSYSTPLALPFPVQVQQGARVRQQVQLRLLGSAISAADSSRPRIVLTPNLKQPMPLPALGLGAASHGAPLTETEIRRLRSLQLSHLRVDLAFANSNWQAQLRCAALDARKLGVRLQLALHPGNDPERELLELLDELGRARAEVALAIVHVGQGPGTQYVCVALAERVLGPLQCVIAAGTDANFAEWNRNRPPPESTALPSYTLNPQVHAFDRASLVENLGGQGDTVQTAWHVTGRPVVISSVTLRPRFNPNATAAESPAEPGALPPQVDPRQMSLLGAAWTLGSLAELSRTGHVHSLTYYETTGWLGVMETAAGSPSLSQFPSIPGAVVPMFHVFAGLAGFGRFCPIDGLPQDSIAGLALLGDKDRLRLLLGNLKPERQVVSLRLPGESASVRILDQITAEQAMREPEAFGASTAPLRIINGLAELALAPFAIACIDT